MSVDALMEWVHPLRYVLPAYAIAILLIGGYARSLGQRMKVLERERAAFDQDDAGERVR
jgi:CcmD family protein